MGSSENGTIDIDVEGGWDDVGDPYIHLGVSGQEAVNISADDAERLAMTLLTAVTSCRIGGGWFRNLTLSGIPPQVAHGIVSAGGFIPRTVTYTDPDA